MEALTAAQIEQKKQQLKRLAAEAQQLKNELVEAGAIELSDDDLDKAAGGLYSLVAFWPDQRPPL